MRSHHGEAISRLVASAHSEGDDAGEIPGHKILKPSRATSLNIINYTAKKENKISKQADLVGRLNVPLIRLFQLRETCL